jgi:hypothetical protein
LQRTWCQSTVMPEPTTCARAGTTSSSTC